MKNASLNTPDNLSNIAKYANVTQKIDMNKAQLALRIAEELDVSKKLAEQFVATFQSVVTEEVAKDQEVTIAGFGTFSSRVRAARKGVNPRNPSEVIQVPAVRVPKFKAGKNLKDALKHPETRDSQEQTTNSSSEESASVYNQAL